MAENEEKSKKVKKTKPVESNEENKSSPVEEVEHAVKIAEQYIDKIMGDLVKNARVEEVEAPSEQNENWNIVISFEDEPDYSSPFIKKKIRLYKELIINSKTGRVKSMRIKSYE